MVADSDEVITNIACTVTSYARGLTGAALAHLRLAAVALALGCATVRAPAGTVMVEDSEKPAGCASKVPQIPRGVSWEGEIRADYSVDELGVPQNVRLDDFSDGAPPVVLQAISEWIRGCQFKVPRAGPVRGSQMFEIRRHNEQRPDSPVSRPTLASCPSPRPVPERAMQLGITGTVLVSYLVASDGRVSHVHLRNGGAPSVLVEAVRDWLLACRFNPALRDGTPVQIRIRQPFIFRLG